MALKKFLSHPGFRKYFSNISWLVGERVLGLGVNLVVGIMVVRYLGPERYGNLAFAQSIVVLAAILANLGLDSTVVRELVNRPEQRGEILGTTFALKLGGGIVAVCCVVGVAFLSDISNLERRLSILIGLGLIFHAAKSIDLHFQSKVQARYVVQVKVAQTVLVATMKLALIWNQNGLVWFAVASLLEAAVLAGGLIFNYHRSLRCPSEETARDRWVLSHEMAVRLLRGSWPLIFSGLALSVYMRIDQVMLRVMQEPTAVGQYGAAVRIAESWLFLAGVITTSLFPAILNAKTRDQTAYMQRLQQFYDLMLWLPVVFAMILWFFANDIVVILFGHNFAPAGPVLGAYAWSGVFVFVITASSRWYITEGYETSVMYRAISGAAINVVLNLVLIPPYGILGAAIATLASYGFMAFFYDLIDRRGRPSFRMKWKSLLLPLRAVFGRVG